MQDIIDLNEIKRRLTLFLKHYEQARGRADFLEVSLGIQTALEQALNAQLSSEDVREKAFAEKFDAVLPNLAAAWNVAELGQLRNRYAHPYTTYSLEQYRALADEFVGLTLAAWPRLFGGAPPGVVAPDAMPDDDRLLQDAAMALKVQKQDLDTAEAKIQELTRRLSETPSPRTPQKRALPWRSLVYGVLLLLPVALLLGFATNASTRRPIPWLMALIPALLAVVLAFFAIRYLWQFIRSAGPLRVLAAVVLVLALATLLAMPFGSRGSSITARAGQSLTRVLGLFSRTMGAPPVLMAQAGNDLADLVAASTVDEPPPLTDVNTAGPTLAPTAMAALTATALPAGVTPAATVTPQPSPTPTAGPQIRVGAPVIVNTDGVPLMGRAAATTDAEIVARFDDGTTLLVVGGPEEADGLIWWQVESEAGDGWSAADYLLPSKP